MKYKWNGTSKLCGVAEDGAKVLPGGVFELDASISSREGIQDMIRQGLLVEVTDTPILSKEMPVEAKESPEATEIPEVNTELPTPSEEQEAQKEAFRIPPRRGNRRNER